MINLLIYKNDKKISCTVHKLEIAYINLNYQHVFQLHLFILGWCH